MSRSRGMLPMRTAPAVSRVAASTGRAAFFAPEMRTSPLRGPLPRMESLSMSAGRCGIAQGGEGGEDAIDLPARMGRAHAAAQQAVVAGRSGRHDEIDV